MPRRKKILYDNRDALEILRNAFWGDETPTVAELGTHAVKTRTVAANKYRESVPDIPRKVSKQIKEDLSKPTIAETGEFKTFWGEKSEEKGEQAKEPSPPSPEPTTELIPEPDQFSKKSPSLHEEKQHVFKHVLKGTTAQRAIDIGLVEKIQQDTKEIGNKNTILPEENRVILEKILKTYEKKINETDAPTLSWESQNKNGPAVEGDEEPLQTPEDIRTYAENVAAKVESPPTSGSKAEVIPKQRRKGTLAPPPLVSKQIAAHGTLEPEPIPVPLKQEPVPPETLPSAPPPPISKPEGEPVETMEQKKERLAKMLIEKVSAEPARAKNKKAEAAQKIQTLLSSKPEASEEYKQFVRDVEQRSVEILESEAEAQPILPPTELPPSPLATESPEKYEQTENSTPKEDEVARWESEGGAIPQEKIESAPEPAPTQTPDHLAEMETAFQKRARRTIDQFLADNQLPTNSQELREELTQAKEKDKTAPHPARVGFIKDMEAALAVLEEREQKQPTQTEEAKKTEAAHKAAMRSPKPLSPEDLPKEKSESRDNLTKTFEEKTAALEKIINETGGTPEERMEHWALEKAQEYGYDTAKISARLEELKKQPVGMVAMETQVLTEALKILKPETAPKKKEPAPPPEAAPDKDKLKRKLQLGEYAPKTPEATPPPPKPEATTEAVKEVSVIVTEAFVNRLGITKESLQNEPMFMRLSEGQQLLILQDLEQIALGKVQSETEKILTQKNVTEAPVDSAWYRRWSATLYQCTTEAIKGIGKKYRLEGTLAADTAKGGMAQYGEILRLLSAETNPHVEVVRKEDGSLDVRYISRAAMAELLDRLPAKEHERGFQYIESLNNAASEFRVMPLAWSSDTASRAQRQAFEKSQKRFQAAEGHLLSFIGKQTESPIEHAKYELMLAQAEHAIQQEQFWNAHPEARTQIQTMTSKSWFTRFLKEGLKERALFVATGGIGRVATIGIAGFASLPITAAAIGGAMLGRAVFRGHMATARGKETLLHRARLLQETKKEGAGMRDYVTSQSLNTGFEKIIKKINAFDARDNTQPLTGEERKEKEHALKQLERILYTAQVRHLEGAVTYGSPATLLPEHFRLGRNISGAQSRLVTASLEGFHPQSKWAQVDDKKVNETINSVWALRKGRMSNERKAYLRKQALVQAGINAASGAFGVWIADTFELGPKFQRGLEKLVKKTGSLSQINFPAFFKNNIKKLPGFDKETLGKLGLEDTPTLKPPKNLPIAPSGGTGKGAIPSVDDFVAPASTPNAAVGVESGGITETVPSGGKTTPSLEEVERALRAEHGPGTPGAGDESVKMESGGANETPVPKEVTEYAKLAEIKKGEGMWHAVRRQLNYQMSNTSPEEFAKRYGVSAEDIKLHPKKSVERITTNLLAEQDYTKPKGAGGAWTETRIAKPGARVILGEDGKIEITGKGKLTYEWQKPGVTTETPVKAGTSVPHTETGKAVTTAILPEKAPPAITERLLSRPENMARKISGLNVDRYAKVRDTSLAEFLKKPPRGKGFQILTEILRREKPIKADLQQTVSEFLTKHFE